MRKTNGQGTLEYVIIFAAIVGAVIFVVALMQPKIRSSYDHLAAETTELLQK